MKKLIYGIFATSALLFAACTADEIPAPETNPKPESPDQILEGELLVKFAPYVSEILDQRAAAATRSGSVATRSGVLPVDQVLDLIGTYEIERVFKFDARNEERTRTSGMHLWYVVRFSGDHSATEVADKLSVIGEVQRVEFNRTIQRAYNPKKKATPLSREAMAAVQAMTRAGETTYPFNDLLLHKQWHLVNRGNMFGDKAIVGADVQCEQAWKLSTGDPSIIVAVLDEGIDLLHPDLKESIWVNDGEVFNSNKDNDGNGYPGDLNGFNFVDNKGLVTWEDIYDTGHGSHVAGVIAARNNNGIGVSSVAGGDANKPGVKIMSCQIFSGVKGANMLGQVRAIKYAADNGAVVLQCSWGYSSGLMNSYEGVPGFTSEEQWILNCPLEKTALDYFTHNAGSPNGVIEGGIAVFAAGNETAAMAGFPGGGEDYVSVAATAADYTPAIYTNYGPGTTISAPGGDQDYYYDYKVEGRKYGEEGTVLSTLPTIISETGYGYMEGTSMACPHVSGVVALALSYAAELRLHFKASDIKKLLYETVTPIDSYMTGLKTYARFAADMGPTHIMTRNMANYAGKMGVGQVNTIQLLNAIAGGGKPMAFPNLYIKALGEVTTLPATFFVGGEKLTYTVTINDTSIATSTTNGSKIVFKGLKTGATKAQIKASNGQTHSFNITVRTNADGNGWL